MLPEEKVSIEYYEPFFTQKYTVRYGRTDLCNTDSLYRAQLVAHAFRHWLKSDDFKKGEFVPDEQDIDYAEGQEQKLIIGEVIQPNSVNIRQSFESEFRQLDNTVTEYRDNGSTFDMYRLLLMHLDHYDLLHNAVLYPIHSDIVELIELFKTHNIPAFLSLRSTRLWLCLKSETLYYFFVLAAPEYSPMCIVHRCESLADGKIGDFINTVKCKDIEEAKEQLLKAMTEIQPH